MSIMMRAVRVAAMSRATAVRSFSSATAASPTEDVIIADMVDSIEWAIPSPPPLHCFEEPPIMFEVEGSAANREH